MTSFQTYKIVPGKSQNNAYGVDREEVWIIKPDTCFSDLKEAKQYVIDMNKKCSDMVLLAFTNGNKSNLDQFYNSFCFDNDSKYYYLRRYFMSKPNLGLIKKQLKENNINTASISS